MTTKNKNPGAGRLPGASILTLWRKFIAIITHPSMEFWLAITVALAFWLTGCADNHAQTRFGFTTAWQPTQDCAGNSPEKSGQYHSRGTMPPSAAMPCSVFRSTFSVAAQTAAVRAVLSCPDSGAGRSPSMACLDVLGLDGVNRKATRAATDVLLTSSPPYAFRSANGGFLSLVGA